MRIYLIRHGLAEDRVGVSSEKQDSLRELTDKGREKSQEMAKKLKYLLEDETLEFVSSPYTRALQTAEIFASTLLGSKSVAIEKSLELTPMTSPMAFAQWLREKKSLSKASVLAFGHEPMMGLLGSWLLAGVHYSFIEVKKSSVLALEVENFSQVAASGARLRWFLTPKTL